MRLSAIFLWLMVAGLLAGVGLYIFDIASEFSVVSLHNVAPVCFLFAGHMLAAAGCAWAREHGRLRALMLTGIYASFASFLILLAMIFGTIDDDIAMIATIPGVWAPTMMLIGALLVARPPYTLGRRIRLASIILIAVLAAQILAWVWMGFLLEPSWSWRESDNFHENMARIFGILGILAASGSLTTYVLARTRAMRGEEEIDESERLPFSMVCPRCGVTATLRTGGDSCSGCGLKVSVAPQ